MRERVSRYTTLWTIEACDGVTNASPNGCVLPSLKWNVLKNTSIAIATKSKSIITEYLTETPEVILQKFKPSLMRATPK